MGIAMCLMKLTFLRRFRTVKEVLQKIKNSARCKKIKSYKTLKVFEDDLLICRRSEVNFVFIKVIANQHHTK